MVADVAEGEVLREASLVELRGDGRVLVRHGLVAAGDIDDGEAAEAEGGPGIAVEAGIIGAAVVDGVRHALDDRGRIGRLKSYESSDSTHERWRGPMGYFSMRGVR